MNPNWLTYQNQGAIRSQPLSPALVKAMGFLPAMGLQMQVFSGGQPAAGGPRTGSVRHDHGNAADVFFTQGGRRLDWNNPADVPVFQDIVRQAKVAGLTGFGAGPGYMQQGSMHIGYGTPAVWGADGKSANAPDWLREAYGAAPAGSAPSALAAGFLSGPPRAAPDEYFAEVSPSALAALYAAPADEGKTSQREQEAALIADRRRKEALFGGPLL